MGVYSRVLEVSEDKIISFEEFVDYFQESDYQMRMMFEKQELVYAIQEANGSDIQLPDIVRNIEFNAGEPEKVKKTLIEWIKEIFDKFIKAVKDLFDKVSKNIHELYMKTNFIDDIVSKYKDKVTYKNLVKAKENGWKGLSIEKKEALINREADTFLSQLFRDNNNKHVRIDEKDFDPIIRARDLKEAKEKYDEFKTKLSRFRSLIMFDTKIDIANRMEGTSKTDIYIGFFGTYMDQNKEYYFPATTQFALTKEFAEAGQIKIKKIGEHYKNLTRGLIEQKSLFLDNMKLFKKKDSVNHTGDKETDQINILFYKAQYEYSSAYIMRTKRVINSVVSSLRLQHRIAIKTYISMVTAVNKYAA